jgi:hypothetical protein
MTKEGTTLEEKDIYKGHLLWTQQSVLSNVPDAHEQHTLASRDSFWHGLSLPEDRFLLREVLPCSSSPSRADRAPRTLSLNKLTA